MLREKSRLIVKSHKLLDIGLTGAAFIAAYFIKRLYLPEPFRGLTTEPNYYIVLLLIIIIWYLIFDSFRLYASYRKQALGKILSDMVKAVSTGMLILFLFMYVLKMNDVSRIMIGIFYILNIGLLACSKSIVYRTLSYYRKKGYNFRNVLIVGSKERAKDVIDAIGVSTGSGYKIIGCLEIDREDIGIEVKDGITVIGTIDTLIEKLWQDVVDELVFAIPLKNLNHPDRYIAAAEKIGVSVRIVPDWQIHSLAYRPDIAAIRFENFQDIPTMILTTTTSLHSEFVLKSVMDYMLGAFLIILSFPLLVIISIAIKLASKGPILYSQERCGLNGRRFKLYKFRTMAADADLKRDDLNKLNEMDGPVFKIEKDPRVIHGFGTFLRKTGLDELPQLINVLKGEMSLVGPRPPIPEEVDEYELGQRRRLSMKPGLTCLWQITAVRNEISFEEWMKMDLEYIDKWSLMLDIKILFKTIWVVLTGSGR